MVNRHDGMRQLVLGLHRVASSRQPLRVRFHRDICTEEEPIAHQLIREGHHLAVLINRWLSDADVVTKRLGHFLLAIKANQQWHKEANLLILSRFGLEISSSQDVECLVLSTHFNVGFDCDRVVALRKRIEELVQGNRRTGIPALAEIITRQHLRHRHLAGELDEIGKGELS